MKADSKAFLDAFIEFTKRPHTLGEQLKFMDDWGGCNRYLPKAAAFMKAARDIEMREAKASGATYLALRELTEAFGKKISERQVRNIVDPKKTKPKKAA